MPTIYFIRNGEISHAVTYTGTESNTVAKEDVTAVMTFVHEQVEPPEIDEELLLAKCEPPEDDAEVPPGTPTAGTPRSPRRPRERPRQPPSTYG